MSSLPLAAVVAASAAVRATSKRSVKIACLAEALAAADPREVAIVATWLAGRLPQGRIGVGYRAIVAAAEAATPADTSTLTVAEVHAAADAIAAISGPGSTTRRREALGALLAAADAEEQQWLLAVIAGAVRQGALDGVVIAAIAKAAAVPVKAVRRAVMLSGDLGATAALAVEGGREALEAVGLRLFVPIQPMLAQTAETPDEALAVLEEAVFDQKLDGARVQVHREGDTVRVFTRHLKEVTGSVPEVVEAALACPAARFVLDGEVLALDRDGVPFPFQTTMRRFGRKLDVAQLREELPLTPGFFDCLLLGAETLIDAPLVARRDALARATGGRWLIPSIQTSDVAEATTFLQETLAAGHEGVMAKGLEGPYQAGSRGKQWFKLKPTHTLDLVVLAAEWGSGRRRGWLSNLHLGARDGDGWAMLGKTFKGMTDEILAWQTEALQAIATERAGHVVHVRPELVVEVAFNEVQQSPHYASGMALRFARIKGYRHDKGPADCDTVATVRGILARGFRDG